MQMTDEKRQAVSQKTNGRCAYCGCITDNMVVDHMVPKKKGGGSKAENLIYACWQCNNLKKAKTVEEFRAYILTGTHPHLLNAMKHLEMTRSYMSDAAYNRAMSKLQEAYSLMAELGQKEHVTFYIDTLNDEEDTHGTT